MQSRMTSARVSILVPLPAHHPVLAQEMRRFQRFGHAREKLPALGTVVILNAAHDSFPTFLPRQQQGDLHNQHPWHRFAAPAQPVAQRFLSYHKISKTTIEETANLKRAKKAHGEPQIMADGGWRFVAGWSQSKSPKLICPSVLWRSSSGGGAASRCRADSASVSQGRIWSRRRISGIRSWMPCIEALGVVVRITNRLAPWYIFGKKGRCL